ncbi:MAG TPA: transposase, partial [Anaerolineae bacterium]|nr:transposase [Anaerolineae bacterium]
MTAPLQFLHEFRQRVLGIFNRRADALFELMDALLLTLDPRSPVELSTSPAFRRRFSMVYDALQHGQVEPERARQLLAQAEPAEALTLAGYAVYGVDTTVDPRPDAETLPDRSKVYGSLGIAVTPARCGGLKCGRMAGILLVRLERSRSCLPRRSRSHWIFR